MLNRSLFAATALAVAACATAPQPPEPQAAGPTQVGQRALGLLGFYFEGTFATVPQAASEGDSTPVTLRIAKFWSDRPGEEWRYLEYVKRGEEAKPMLQRIYRFTEAGGEITGTRFDLPGDPTAFVGEWRKPRPFAGVTPGSLKERFGCRMRVLRQIEIRFAGGTTGKACRGERPEIAHEQWDFYAASSSIRILEAGFDASGKKVRGPAGPWEFRKSTQNTR